jgi:hypothetical protein
MKAHRLYSILVIVSGLLFFCSCSSPKTSPHQSLCKQEKVVKNEILAIAESLTNATVQKAYPKLFNLVDTYFADDVVIKYVDPGDPNRRVQIVPLAQYKYMVRQMPQFILDYTQQDRGMQITVASDCASVRIRGVQMERTTMSTNAAMMMAPYMFKKNPSKRFDDEVTIESEEKYILDFERREGNWFITLIDTEVIKADFL